MLKISQRFSDNWEQEGEEQEAFYNRFPETRENIDEKSKQRSLIDLSFQVLKEFDAIKEGFSDLHYEVDMPPQESQRLFNQSFAALSAVQEKVKRIHDLKMNMFGKVVDENDNFQENVR